MRTKGSQNELEKVRRHAVSIFEATYDAGAGFHRGKGKEIAKRVAEASYSSVMRWRKDWLDEKSPEKHRITGRPCKLNDQQRDELIQCLKDNPHVRWTLAIIGNHIEVFYKVKCTPSAISKMLKGRWNIIEARKKSADY